MKCLKCFQKSRNRTSRSTQLRNNISKLQVRFLKSLFVVNRFFVIVHLNFQAKKSILIEKADFIISNEMGTAGSSVLSAKYGEGLYTINKKS